MKIPVTLRDGTRSLFSTSQTSQFIIRLSPCIFFTTMTPTIYKREFLRGAVPFPEKESYFFLPIKFHISNLFFLFVPKKDLDVL